MSDEEVYEDVEVGTHSTLLSNGVYDKLKFLSLVLLPALGTLYFGLSEIWGFPFGAEVVGSLVVVDTFFGVLLGVSSRSHSQATEGQVVGIVDVATDPDTGAKQHTLLFPGNPDDIDKHDKITFKVRRN